MKNRMIGSEEYDREDGNSEKQKEWFGGEIQRWQ